MNNLIKQRPEVGDIMIIVDGERRFVRGSECTTEFIDTQDAVGGGILRSGQQVLDCWRSE